MVPDELRGWSYYRTAIRALRVAAGAFLLALCAFALMSLEVQVRVIGVIAAALIGVLVIAIVMSLPLFSRVSRIHSEEAAQRGGQQIGEGLPLLRVVLSDVACVRVMTRRHPPSR